MVEMIPLSGPRLQSVISGGLKSAASVHPGSVNLRLASSISKRISGQIMAETKSARFDALARIRADIDEIKALRAENYLLRQQFTDMKIACPVTAHWCRSRSEAGWSSSVEPREPVDA